MIDKIQQYLDGLAGPFITLGSYLDDYWSDGTKVTFRGEPALRYSAYVADQSTAKELSVRMGKQMRIDDVSFNYRASSHHQTTGRFAGKYKVEIYIW